MAGDLVAGRCGGGDGQRIPMNLETAVEANHDRHERLENNGRNCGEAAPGYRLRPMTTPDSLGPSVFVFFVFFVVPTAFFRMKQMGFSLVALALALALVLVLVFAGCRRGCGRRW